MKFLLSLQLICIILLFGSFPSPFEQNNKFAQLEVPPYAKWGQISMEKTKQKYPKADIIDYLHIGRESGAETSVEKFKLWLRENKKEFGVYVDITFNSKTEEIIKVDIRKAK